MSITMSNPASIDVQRRAYLSLLRGLITPAEYLRTIAGRQR